MSTPIRHPRLTILILAAGCFTTGLNVGVISPLITQVAQDFGASDALVGQAAALHAAIAGLTLITWVADAAGWRWALSSLLIPTVLVALATAWLPARTAPISSRQDAVGYRQVFAHPDVNWLLVSVITLCMVSAGWVVFFGAFTFTVFAISANALSLLFLAGGAAELLASNLMPVLLRLRPARTIFASLTLLVSLSLLTVGAVRGGWWLLVPFVVLLSFGGAALYLTITVLLLDALPSARGAVMALQTGCFEIGWAAGTALTGAALVSFGSYAGAYRLLALLLPLSLVCLLLSSRRKPHVGVQVAVIPPTTSPQV